MLSFGLSDVVNKFKTSGNQLFGTLNHDFNTVKCDGGTKKLDSSIIPFEKFAEIWQNMRFQYS